MNKTITELLEQIQNEQQSQPLGILRTRLIEEPHIRPAKDLVIAIQGVRRCGKSTLLRQIAATKEIADQAIFINFEDPRLGDQLDDGLLDSIVAFHEGRSAGNAYYFFDEIQNVRNWERWLHIQLERKQRYFFITGSNSTLLGGKLGTSLTGRHLTVELFPFSFKEFKELRPSSTLEEYLETGGFPRPLTFEEPKALLREYFTDIIERDVRRHVAARSAVPLIHTAKAIFEATGSETSLRNLARAFDSTADTVRTYVDALEAAYLCLSCPFFTYSTRKSAVRPKKFYPVDLGLRAAIATKTGLDHGKKLETAVFLALRRKNANVWYWRGKGEVDFVIETEHGIQPIQVSWNGAKERHVQALAEFKKEYPQSLPGVIVDRANALQYL